MNDTVSKIPDGIDPRSADRTQVYVALVRLMTRRDLPAPDEISVRSSDEIGLLVSVHLPNNAHGAVDDWCACLGHPAAVLNPHVHTTTGRGHWQVYGIDLWATYEDRPLWGGVGRLQVSSYVDAPGGAS